MKQIPLLFLSDSPHLPTGLARITKDLATQACQLPQFRVGVLGRGGHGSSQLPFVQYNFGESEQWGEGRIEEVWEDFARGEQGVVFTIWDLSRLGWFARPNMGRVDPKYVGLEKFLRSGKFRRWGYFPIDSYGVGGGLTRRSAYTLKGYDRMLAYSLFGQEVINRSIPSVSVTDYVDWIPHGYNEEVFRPRDRVAGRAMLQVREELPLVGCVMTNQARKDWATAIVAFAAAREKIPGLTLWMHIDVLERYWSIPGLLEDLGLGPEQVKVTFNGEYSSRQLSYLYSACDLTMLPSLGEGFGFPIVESLACGVPVLHTQYGGGAELVPERNWLVDPAGLRLDGLWNCYRPVLDAGRWAEKIVYMFETGEAKTSSETCISSVRHLGWDRLWGVWKKWFEAGVEQ